MKIANGMRPSPEKVKTFVEGNPLSEIEDPEERKRLIGDLADMLNQLEPDELTQLVDPGERTENRRRDLFLDDMTEEEQWYFMEKRMGRAFDQMMAVFNDMDPEDRKRIVERTLRDMERRGDNEDARQRMLDEDPELADKIVNEGLRAYYQKASAETKLDLAPLLEEMQRNVGIGVRGRGDRKNDR
ncbi:MAG: hypothetical protein HKN23_09795 [Verrucomicrobiales bacterium]|nr:hypothetical protein [Verrucomicrobiales bacterium]